MKFTCNLLEPRQLQNNVIRVKDWNRKQNAADLGDILQCLEYAFMLHIILLRAHFSQNVKYCYEIRDYWYQFFTHCEELVPIFHAL